MHTSLVNHVMQHKSFNLTKLLLKLLKERFSFYLILLSGVLKSTVESRFLEPPEETQIDSRNQEFEKSKVASNYA